jgi:hypothetical protein
MIADVRRQQGVESIVLQPAFQRLEPDVLKEDVTPWIGDNGLDDSITALLAGVGQPVTGNALLERLDFMLGVPLFFRKEIGSRRDHEPKVPRGGMIDERVVNLIENTVGNGEPDPAFARDRRADAGLRT